MIHSAIDISDEYECRFLVTFCLSFINQLLEDIISSKNYINGKCFTIKYAKNNRCICRSRKNENLIEVNPLFLKVPKLGQWQMLIHCFVINAIDQTKQGLPRRIEADKISMDILLNTYTDIHKGLFTRNSLYESVCEALKLTCSKGEYEARVKAMQDGLER